MTTSLYDFFTTLPDPRRKKSRRHELADVLSIVVLAILFQSSGYRGFERFGTTFKDALVDRFHLKHGIPTHVTIRDVWLRLDWPVVNKMLTVWMISQLPKQEAGSTNQLDDLMPVGLDGKAIRSTVSSAGSSSQDFVSLVNAYAFEHGLCIAQTVYQNKKSYEADEAVKLIESIPLEKVLFIMDALHLKKNFSSH